MLIEIKSMFDAHVIVSGDYQSVKECLEKNRNADLRGADLRGADLWGANLWGANLRGANLWGADLWGANLRGAKNYRDSHDFYTEIIRRQPVSVFVDAEWAAVAQITIHRLCWDTIKKRFSDVAPSIFKMLADAGFDEWLNYWNEINK